MNHCSSGRGSLGFSIVFGKYQTDDVGILFRLLLAQLSDQVLCIAVFVKGVKVLQFFHGGYAIDKIGHRGAPVTGLAGHYIARSVINKFNSVRVKSRVLPA